MESTRAGYVKNTHGDKKSSIEICVNVSEAVAAEAEAKILAKEAMLRKSLKEQGELVRNCVEKARPKLESEIERLEKQLSIAVASREKLHKEGGTISSLIYASYASPLVTQLGWDNNALTPGAWTSEHLRCLQNLMRTCRVDIFSEDTYEREILADVLAWRLRKGHGKACSITGDGYI